MISCTPTRFSVVRIGLVGAFAGLLAWLPAPLAAQMGRIAGTVVDGTSGRPVNLAIVSVPGRQVSLLTDLQGRFRSGEVPVGTYTVEVTLLGYATLEQTGVVVTSGQTVLLDLALSPEALALDAIIVETARVQSSSTSAGLLATQRTSANISDGISAQQIRLAPDSDAGDAVKRVTGVSVVDDQFVVVRGLGERYSNTLLNGAEIASPEPTKRIVPLNIFPASLLESVVTHKAATPDKPGDFAGGLVEIRTKEFPEQRVLEMDIGAGFSSITTFEQLPIFAAAGRDVFGLDGRNRYPGTPQASERFAESIRNEWAPPPRTIPPDMKVEVNYGDQFGDFDRAVGLIVSGTYANRASWSPGNFFGFSQGGDSYTVRQTSNQGTRGVDVGSTANLAFRLGSAHTLTLKNLFTRNTEEFNAQRYAFLGEVADDATFATSVVGYQVRYLERTFIQSQLGGSHLFAELGNARLDWSATASWANRDEPENRPLNYLVRLDGRGQQVFPGAAKNFFQWRYLKDDVYSGKVDLQMPFSALNLDDAMVKVGGYYRAKTRDSDATIYELQRGSSITGDDPVLFLPPEQLFAPENLDSDRLHMFVGGAGGIPYEAEDNLAAGYGMVDLRRSDVRLVAGARVEQWDLTVTDGSGTRTRSPIDVLGSANVTWSFTDAMNFRAAAYQTVSRPDPRELTESKYQSVTGECSELGTPSLQHTRIMNADLRLEWYPTPGELISMSGFYKRFDEPIVQLVQVESLGCEFRPFNADLADNLGIEIEGRKSLGMIADALESWSAVFNVMWVTGAATTKRGEDFDVPGELPLQDQSEYLVNASLGYANPETGLDFTVLFNWFADRVRRYGTLTSSSGGGGGVILGRAPDVYEEGRPSVDFKIRRSFGPRWSMSVSGSNLTNEDQVRFQRLEDGTRLPIGFVDLPVSFSLGAKYRF